MSGAACSRIVVLLTGTEDEDIMRTMRTFIIDIVRFSGGRHGIHGDTWSRE
jgi:hypothetical protein